MLNLKKNLYIAGAFALCALAACSSDNPSSAGSTTMPNATDRRKQQFFGRSRQQFLRKFFRSR